ncbi:MAG: SDR family NAD(P)-dependent oxidoreductase [Saccharothrix sp.]|nr:SDR family NAD(P)-dependent oxidoreductase [Saccharothrix sp.]
MATIAGSAVLITGANRGIGRALVEEALKRGAKRVYAGTRQALTHPDERVTPVTLDVTDAEQIKKVAAEIGSLDILINNAGMARYDDLSDRAALDLHFATNLYGMLDVTNAFLPQLTSAKGVLVNNLSVNSLAPLPFIPAYSVSKAAAFSLTQSLRALLAGRGVRVHAVLTGPTDTDMSKDFNAPKAAPADVAKAIFDGVEKEEDDIFPDGLSESLAESWRGGAVKGMEQQFASFAQQG